MNREEIEACSSALFNALNSAVLIEPLRQRYPELTIADAYAVSLSLLQRRLENGEKIVGKKIGITSAVVQEMLNVDQPDFGFLTDAMWLENGTTVSLREHKLYQSRAEGELAFKLKADLVGPGVTESDVFAATESILPCFEIVDSRIRNWDIKIQDTVADNASCGVFVVGEPVSEFQHLNLQEIRMEVFKNGEKISEGKGADVLGNPLTAVAWLANTLGEYGISLKKGEIVLSGSFVPMEWVSSGDQFEVVIDNVGRASIGFVD